MLDRETLERALLMGHTIELSMYMGRVQIILKREGWENTQVMPMDHHLDRLSSVVNWQVDKSIEVKNTGNG
jgi:hypothetical protein